MTTSLHDCRRDYQVGADYQTGGGGWAGCYHVEARYYVLGEPHDPDLPAAADEPGFTPYRRDDDGDSFAAEWGLDYPETFPTVEAALGAVVRDKWD